MLHIDIIAKPKEKIACLFMSKVASSSIPISFLPSQAERQHFDQEIKKIKELKYSVQYQGWYIYHMLLGIPRTHIYAPAFTNLLAFRYRFIKKEWVVGRYSKTHETYRVQACEEEMLQEYFTFTFVRNPFRRLVSFFQNKCIYNKEDKLYHATQLGIGDLGNKNTFEGFADMISTFVKQKNEDMNRHFYLQSVLFNHFRQAGGKIDFIGKLENIEKDFEPLRAKYNLLPLERMNDSSGQTVLHKNWRDYYTPETAKLVYDRWHEDFVQLGYEMEYPKLLRHLGAPLPLRFRKRQFFAKLGLPAYKKYLA